MSDVRSSFPSLEGSAGEGLPLHKVLEGDASAAKNASAGLVAKRQSDGTLQYINLDDAGNMLVVTDGAGLCKQAATATPIGGSNSKTTVCEIALTIGKQHRNLEWGVTNFRDTIYEIEVIDDPLGTPSIALNHTVLCGPGDMTDTGKLHCFEFDTTGMTAPVLRLSGTNLNSTSDFRGTIAITEDVA